MESRFSFQACARCSKDSDLVGLFASQLASKVRNALQGDSLIIGVVGAGSELSEQMAKLLGIRSEILHIRPVFWPQHSGTVVGAVSGLTDVIYIDYKALNGAAHSSQALMAEIQAAKLTCMKEAIGSDRDLSRKAQNTTTIFLCCCAHAPRQVLEAAMQNIALKPPLGIYIVTPFLSREVKDAFESRVDSFVYLGEFDPYEANPYL